jgi:glyoxylase-like metal-dependent hydrolase (beta-lactamase superfamily II)
MSISPFLGVMLLMFGVTIVRAAAPMVKTQPGFYRLMVGDFEVTALNDGVVTYQVNRVLPESTLKDSVPLSYNAFLINTGSKLVLIDTGTGGKLDDQPEFKGAGHLMANLRAAGYEPAQVDEVYITHRGPDHIGGLTVDGKRAFPNALVRAPRREFEMFLDPARSAKVLVEARNQEKVRAWLEFTRGLLTPYIEAGKLQAFDADTSLVPGIRALATYGHTPGHTAYVVESRGQTLIVIGDLVLMEPLQFANPLLGSSFDADPKSAAEERVRVFKMAADGGYGVAGGHLPFPGMGHLRAAEGGYVWMPATYRLPQ